MSDNPEYDELMDRAAAGGELADGEVLIDLSEAEDYEPFTAVVPTEVVAATLKTGKSSGKPYIELRLRVTEGEHEGRQVFTNINLTGKGASFGRRDLEKLGARSKDGTPISKDNVRIDVAGLVGLTVQASCAPDPREEYADKVVVNRLIKSAPDASLDEVK